jgi:hypothetical protein
VCVNGTVVSLNVNSNSKIPRLTGTMGTAIGALVHLTSLTLRDNDLQSTLVSELLLLSRLVTLDLASNNFTGSGLRFCTGNGSVLQNLQLASNDLSAPLSVARCTALRSLNAQLNRLDASLDEIGVPACLQLRELRLQSSLLTGTFPPLQLKELVHLQLFSNAVSGTLPSTLALSTGLTTLQLNDMPLVGQLPTEFSRLTNPGKFRSQRAKSPNALSTARVWCATSSQATARASICALDVRHRQRRRIRQQQHRRQLARGLCLRTRPLQRLFPPRPRTRRAERHRPQSSPEWSAVSWDSLCSAQLSASLCADGAKRRRHRQLSHQGCPIQMSRTTAQCKQGRKRRSTADCRRVWTASRRDTRDSHRK